MRYLVLLRGVNVGGKNKLRMAELKVYFEYLGLKNVTTYIQSGNVIFDSNLGARQVAELIESGLTQHFKLDSALIRAFVLSKSDFKAVVAKAPPGFGRSPLKYYCDFIFLKGVSPQQVLAEIELNPEVDAVWAGPGVLYFQRLAAKRTSSRLSKIISRPVYRHMTIRSSSTTTKLLELLESG